MVPGDEPFAMRSHPRAFLAPNAGVGTGAKGPCFQQGGAAPSTTAANNCSAQTPCYIPTIVKNGAGQSGTARFSGSRLTTSSPALPFVYLHPVAENIYAINFDYNSQYTTGLTGDISDFPHGSNACSERLAGAADHTNEIRASGTGIFQLTRRNAFNRCHGYFHAVEPLRRTRRSRRCGRCRGCASRLRW